MIQLIALLALFSAAPASRPHATKATATTRPASASPKDAFGADALKALYATPVSAKKPPKAFVLVTGQLTSTRVLRARFTQRKKLKALRFPLRSKGRFLFASKRGIAWRFQTPFRVSFVITPRQITQRAHGKTTRISGKKKPLIMGFTRMFLTIFQGQASQLHKHFKVYFQGTPTGWHLGLVPRHKLLGTIFRRITLQGAKTIRHVQMAERSGDTTTLHFSQIQTTPLTAQEKALF